MIVCCCMRTRLLSYNYLLPSRVRHCCCFNCCGIVESIVVVVGRISLVPGKLYTCAVCRRRSITGLKGNDSRLSLPPFPYFLPKPTDFLPQPFVCRGNLRSFHFLQIFWHRVSANKETNIGLLLVRLYIALFIIFVLRYCKLDIMPFNNTNKSLSLNTFHHKRV